MNLNFLDLRKEFVEADSNGKIFKRLTLGYGGGIVTDCRRSFDLKPTTLYFYPGEMTYFVYAKCPRDGSAGELISSNEVLSDTKEDFFVLIKKGTYSELDF